VLRRGELEEYLIPPEELITLPVLEMVPNVQELSNTVVSYVIRIVLSLIPAERSPKRQETHDGKVFIRSTTDA